MKTLKDSLNENLNEVTNVFKDKTLLDFLKWYTGKNDPISDKRTMVNLYKYHTVDSSIGDDDGYVDMVNNFKKHQNDKIEVINDVDWFSIKMGEKIILFNTNKKIYK